MSLDRIGQGLLAAEPDPLVVDSTIDRARDVATTPMRVEEQVDADLVDHLVMGGTQLKDPHPQTGVGGQRVTATRSEADVRNACN